MRQRALSSLCRTCIALFVAVIVSEPNLASASDGRIRPYEGNPRYWQYRGRPVLLLGGSKDDNLFQIPDLKQHLDEMASVGANYIRNTMSDRSDHGFEVHPFAQRADGRFDLDRWNDEYWQRFENMLAWTAERDIIVQIELWDKWDMHAEIWIGNPWNPANNVNYTYDETALAAAYARPTYRDGTSHGKPHDFFLTVPALNDDRILLSYQRRFVDKVLSYSLRCDHVLYCVSNEIHPQYPPQWGWYWADYLRQQASAADREIEVAEMYWALDLKAEQHRASLDHPDVYSFFEASQNSGTLDPEENWQNLQFVYRHLGFRPRPINNTKIYGADGGSAWAGTTRNAQEKFWRNIIGGSASSRFHRPATGLGLSEAARVHIKSLRMLTDAMQVFTCEPRNDLLVDRSANEAYCLAELGRQYAVYFPDGGEVMLDISAARGSLQMRWLDIARSVWRPSQAVAAGGKVELKAPGRGHWAVMLQSAPDADEVHGKGRVRPWSENPHYLAWGDTPVFPLGATGYHSWTPISRPGTMDFRQQLDRLAAVVAEIGSPHVCGFVRCLPYDPMNHMHDGAVKEVLQPWSRHADGRYDLERFEPAWEERLRAFLSAAFDHRIVVSLEIWDDWSITRGPGGAYDPGVGAAWNAHPFNPRNNVNYDEGMLPATTSVCDAPFYSTIPSRRSIQPVLDLQRRYVDHLLAIASDYPNVLISIANESRAHLEWSRFWAEYVRQRVPTGTMIGEMPSTNRKDGGGECEPSFSPLTLCTDSRYDYVDISQGVSGHEFGNPREQAIGGGRRILEYRRAMAEVGTRRPLIVSKDYTRGPDGGDIVLWGRFVGGAAAARFHRLAGDHPESVSRFQHEAIARLGRFIAQVPFWRMHPEPGLVARLPAGAGVNVLGESGVHYAIQLIGGDDRDSLDVNLPSGTWAIQWIDPATGKELARSEADAGSTGLRLGVPAGSDHRIVYLVAQPR